MMPREKRRFKYEELEEHTVLWGVERLDELRDMAQETYMNDRYLPGEKEFMLESIATQVQLLLELVSPLSHDQPNLIQWAHDFVDEYIILDDDRDD